MPDLTHWEHTARDVVPNLVPGGAPRDVGADLLVALLGSEGTAWVPPYGDVRRRLGIRKKQLSAEEQAPGNQRIRTYMALYRSLGLTYEDGGTLQVTEAGDRLMQLVTGYYEQVDAFGLAITPSLQRAVARLMLPVLARVQLRSPVAAATYPADADIHPLRALWRAARECDDKIHWEEISRCLTPCLREADLDQAIGRVQAARVDAGYDPNDLASCDHHLGPRHPDLLDVREQKDRVTIPWLSKAAFKNIIFETNDGPDGYRHLVAVILPMLDAVLARPVEHHDFDSVGDYMNWVGAAPPVEGGAEQENDWNQLRSRVLDRVARYGHNRIITLVGPAGSGKSTMAADVAHLITEGDERRGLVLQFHAAYSYEDLIGGMTFDARGRPVPGPGVLLRFFDIAARDPSNRYVVLFDEFSRADVANVLGELLTYIEHREARFSIPTLPGAQVYVPANLTFLATMNPRDRSVIGLDDALLRRLRQVDVPASSKALTGILQASGMQQELADQVVDWFERLPDDAPFAHGIFVDVVDEGDLHDLWHEVINRYLYRGGVATFRDPAAVERGFPWRAGLATTDDSGVAATSEAAEQGDPPDTPDDGGGE